MSISVFDLFSIGIGPSSSHTVGPMRAAKKFTLHLQSLGGLSSLHHIVVDLYGSLALTGKGHCTDIAILLGLQGETPEEVDPNQVKNLIQSIRESQRLNVLGVCDIFFQEHADLLFHGDKVLPFHPNGMRFTAYDEHKKMICQQIYYSTGGGFIVEHEAAIKPFETQSSIQQAPYPFKTADQLLQLCREHRLSIPQLMRENEKTWRSDSEIKQGLNRIWQVMRDSVKKGCEQDGILPGGLNVRRRAAEMFRHLQQQESLGNQEKDPAQFMDWVSLWALAVNEENAAGGRVVTAPTNGAAGIIPSVIHYYQKYVKGASQEGIEDFLLTAAAIGILYKEGASISAAEMGCMGEVGVACSMAAGALVAAKGGTNEQIENAAEIGMEHNLGLTCDPVAGLVQIPCIERNTMGAAKAINAARLAFIYGNGQHHVSLDQVIATMKQTGLDMKVLYKETSQGGLAVNVPAC